MLARLRGERDRFLAFALAGGDVLLEVDAAGRVVFAGAGAAALSDRALERLHGQQLVDLVAEADRLRVARALSELESRPHVGPLPVALRPPLAAMGPLVLAGCRLPELEGRAHLVLRRSATALPSGRDPESGLLGRHAFVERAAGLLDARPAPQLRLALFDLGDWPRLAADLDAPARGALLGAIGALLMRRGACAECAGRLGERGFALLHRAEVDPGAVARDIARLSRRADPAGLGVTPRALAVAADAVLAAAGGRRAGLARLVESFLGDGQAVAPPADPGGLASALEGAFELALQPVVDLESRAVHHYEALARLPHGGSPVPMVSFAEEAGLVADFDLLVCRRVVALLHEAPGSAAIAVNLSGRSLESTAFAGALLALLDRAGAIGERLLFELTETVDVRRPEAVAAVLAELRQRGFRVCLDDFGSGAAAFHYLRAFAVDYVKIDGLYLRDERGRAPAILRGIVGLCRELGVPAIAEMVEREPQVERLRTIGVRYGQGFLFGRPSPAARLLGLRPGA